MTGNIFILQRILPHYRAGFFKKFCSRYPGSKIIYGNTSANDSLQNFPVEDSDCFVACPNIYFGKSGKIFVSEIYKLILHEKPQTIVSVFNTGNLNIYILLFLRIFMKFKLILWSFGYDPVRGFNPEKNFSDRIRLYLCRKANAVIFYWQRGLEEVKKFSANSRNFFVAPNTLDTNQLFILKENFDLSGKEKIKSELGIRQKFHFVFIGRLIPDKETDRLLKAYKIVEDRIEDCRLTIIGTGSERKNLETLASELQIRSVFFEGEVLDDEITGKWIYASDAFVMPGRLGLSVVHSFCFGVPVISQNKAGYFHGEGVGYVRDGINGFLTKDNDLNDLAEKMILATKCELAAELGRNAFKTAKEECSIEMMLEGFSKAIEYAANN